MHAFIDRDPIYTGSPFGSIDIRQDNGRVIDHLRVEIDAIDAVIARVKRQYPGIEIVEQTGHVTPEDWHHVVNHSDQRGWSTYMPGGTWDLGPWFETRDEAIREANAQTG